MNTFSYSQHLVQSPLWGEFKEKMGNPSYSVSGVQFSLHKLPLLPFFVAYAPKVDLEKVDFKEIFQKAKELKAIVVRFDIPVSNKEFPLLKKSPKDTFAKHTVSLNLTPSLDDLFKNFKEKTRYNIRLAQKHGVVVKESSDISIFLNLNKETAKRQGFYVHSDDYYKTMFEIFHNKGLATQLTAYLGEEPLACWILVVFKDVLYYPYGASSNQHREAMASNLLMWEAIKLGKSLNCKLFDMWGATNNEKDPWWGFTKFKLGYGGELVEGGVSQDLVINNFIYTFFNLSYKIVWFFLGLIKIIKKWI